MPISKVGSAGIKDANLTADDLSPGTITNAKLADATIENAKLANTAITINGTSIALGASGDIVAGVDWQSVIVADGSTATTAVAGEGYFIDTTSAAHTVTLPSSPTQGDSISIADYAGTFATNAVTIARNGNNIQGIATNGVIEANFRNVRFTYVDATKGWVPTIDATADNYGALYTEATGGTVITNGDYKVHAFTSSSCFVVSKVGNSVGGGSSVEYLVVAGGGGGGADFGGGAGAGGFRLYEACSPNPLNAPAGVTVTATTYPITVGAGGSAATESPASNSVNGSNSVFSTITSAGGGRGGMSPGNLCGSDGGSGGAARYSTNPGSGSGNVPPVSPPQGNDAGTHTSGQTSGGGGAGAAGESNQTTNSPGIAGADGGIGSYITTSFIGTTSSPSYGETGPNGRYFAGGAGSGGYAAGEGAGGTGGGGGGGPRYTPTGGATAGTTNTGGGGAGAPNCGPAPGTNRGGGAGGSGIVLIRYKYQ